MPFDFDEHKDGGGGGDDPHHKNMRIALEGAYTLIGEVADNYEVCNVCYTLELVKILLANLIVNDETLDPNTANGKLLIALLMSDLVNETVDTAREAIKQLEEEEDDGNSSSAD